MDFLDIPNYFVKLGQAIGNVRKLQDIPHLYEVLIPDRSARAGITWGLGGAAGAGLWNTLTPDEYDVNPLIPAALLSSIAAGGDVAYRHRTAWNDLQKETYQFLKQVDLPAYLAQQGKTNPSYLDIAEAVVKLGLEQGLTREQLGQMAPSIGKYIINEAAEKLKIPTLDQLSPEQRRAYYDFMRGLGGSPNEPLMTRAGNQVPRKIR